MLADVCLYGLGGKRKVYLIFFPAPWKYGHLNGTLDRAFAVQIWNQVFRPPESMSNDSWEQQPTWNLSYQEVEARSLGQADWIDDCNGCTLSGYRTLREKAVTLTFDLYTCSHVHVQQTHAATHIWTHTPMYTTGFL